MMNRRRWFYSLFAVAGAFVAAVVGIPSAILALAPALDRRRRHDWKPVGPLSDFPPGSMKRAVVGQDGGRWPNTVPAVAVYVWRAADDEIVVFSRSCTDLGCPVTWDAGSEWFFCPCHGGIFSKDGTPQAGPPPRPLHRYATRVSAGVVQIDLNSLPPEA